MWFHLDPSGGTPIYLQIVDQIKQAVAGGILRPGERLPSTRDLAIELAVNPNTVIKAYQVLEREGIIEIPRGRGAFVAASPRVGSEEERARTLRASVERLVAEAYRLGCADEEVIAMVRSALAAARARRAGRTGEGS
ncbi:MAG: GntR family transcriptional regulator [Firmicutes bacterium]|nr:GntR family transcriptional regulator [Bacillota bacterium]